jgi:dTDP-4-dehydrorhamnose 3,5-epimerase
VTLFAVERSELDGCALLRPTITRDARGHFVKVYNKDFFSKNGFSFSPAEQFYSVSGENVVRGMHFQLPPHEHAKIVFCTDGVVADFVVDLRVGSPTFRQHARFDLTADSGEILYIPVGFAHGFCVPFGHATMMYLVSERDSQLPELCNFESPFEYV